MFKTEHGLFTKYCVLLLLLLLTVLGHAQIMEQIYITARVQNTNQPLWHDILNPVGSTGCPDATSETCGVNWQNAGVGGIPSASWGQYGTTITPTGGDQTSQIQTALTNCSAAVDKYVLLSAGTFIINTTVNNPGVCVLRGLGADQTIISGSGTSQAPITMGTHQVSYTNAANITSGAVAGSTNITVSGTTGMSVNGFLVITEFNDTSYVTINGSESPNCYYCDGWGSNPWTDAQSRARGQIVQITNIAGSLVSYTPALYTDYTLSPTAVPVANPVKYAGVENLQILGNNTYSQAMIFGQECMYCWIRGVEVNYTDANYVEFDWGYRDEIRDSYFSNSYNHGSGTTDGDVLFAYKTSYSLMENNIIERPHVPIQLNEGVAGNVVAYNFGLGEFGSGPAAYNWALGGIQFHDAHPQFNLLEGNVMRKMWADAVHGSSSNNTPFRNWFVGTSKICAPVNNTRAAIDCTAPPAQSSFQESQDLEVLWLSTYYNAIGNVLGSAAQASLVNGSPLSQVASIQYPSVRSYDHVAYNMSFGYGESSDDGTGTGCNPSGISWGPCHSTKAFSTVFLHGNYTHANGTITWAAGVTHSLPASFYLVSEPSWWTLPCWPCVGPDVTGGTGPGGHSSLTTSNPAMDCYFRVMGGIDGGLGSPLSFNADICYGSTSGGPLVYAARPDPCVHGYSTNAPTVAPFYDPTKETCKPGATTGQLGSALIYQNGVSDPLPFNSLASGIPAVANTSFVSQDFNSYNFFVTDQSTLLNTTNIIMGSDGSYDAFGTGVPPFGNSPDMLFSPQNGGSVPLIYHILENRVLAHTCTPANPCAVESNIIGVVGYDPSTCVSPCIETSSISASGSAYGRNPNDPPNTLYEVQFPKVYKDTFTSHLTGGIPDGVGDTLSRVLYVDYSSDTGGSIPCSVAATDYVSRWQGQLSIPADGSIVLASGGGPGWHAATAYTNDSFIQPIHNITGIQFMVYQATTAGTSGSTEPLWSTNCSTQGSTCTGDGGVTWTATGKVNGQGPGFDIFYFSPTRGCRRMNTRLAKTYNGTNEGANWPASGSADAAGQWITPDAVTCFRMGGSSCGTSGTVNLTDKSTIHAAGAYLNGRYIRYSPTGSGAVNTNYTGGGGDATMSATGNGSCTPTISWTNFQTWPNAAFVSGNSYTLNKYVTSPVDNNLYQLTGATGVYTTDPSADLGNWQYNSSYCYIYVFDMYSNTVNPVLELGPHFGGDTHSVAGYGLGLSGGKYYEHNITQPNCQNTSSGGCAISPNNYIGAPNPGTASLPNALPTDGHPSYRADGVLDLQPVPIFTFDTPEYGNSSIQSACGGGAGFSSYCAAGYGEIAAFSVDGLETLYRFGHNYCTGINPLFSAQECVGVFSQDGRLGAYGSDFINTRGDHITGANACVKPLRAQYQPALSGAVNFNDVIFPLGNNSGSDTYKAVGFYSGTYPSGSYVASGSGTEVSSVTYTLTAAATAVGGSTIYTTTTSSGASNAAAGDTVKIAGFTTGANNGTFIVTASTNVALTVNNPSGAAETHAGTAKTQLVDWDTLCPTAGQYCTIDHTNSPSTGLSLDNGILWQNTDANSCRADVAIIDVTSAHALP